MDVIKFINIPDDNSEFTSYLEQQFSQLIKDQFQYKLKHQEQNVSSLACLDWPEYLAISDVVDTFRHYFSTGVAEYIVEELEKKLVMEMIRDFKYSKQESDSIYKYCQQILFLEEETSLRDEGKVASRKGKIYSKVFEYLAEERMFDLSGFIQFRLKNYCQELKTVVEYALDEYTLDQDYQEFIRLLRYFISTQETKVPLLHVLHMDENNFIIYNEQKKEIPEQEVEKHLQSWAGQKIIYEGLIISALISMAPQEVTVHTLARNHQVMQTLQTIFAERLILCEQCNDCQLWRKQKRQQSVGEQFD